MMGQNGHMDLPAVSAMQATIASTNVMGDMHSPCPGKHIAEAQLRNSIDLKRQRQSNCRLYVTWIPGHSSCQCPKLLCRILDKNCIITIHRMTHDGTRVGVGAENGWRWGPLWAPACPVIRLSIIATIDPPPTGGHKGPYTCPPDRMLNPTPPGPYANHPASQEAS